MCGVEFTGRGPHPGPRECCRGSRDPTLDCDNKYFGMGPAFEDMLDFMRDESLWLRKYLDSWWAATENNFGNLSPLIATGADVRQTLSDDMNLNCLYPEGQCDNLTAASPCFLVTGGVVSYSQSEKTDYFCMNKHRPISEQRPNGVSAVKWQYMSVVALENPQSSSAVSAQYSAERALYPQWRVQTGNTDFALHTSFNNDPWNTSCSITNAEASAWWSADFTNGASAVSTIQVFAATGYEAYLDGATVYIDNVDCGDLDSGNARPSAAAPQWIEFRNTSRNCRDLTGSNVRIEQTSGNALVLCGIMVHSEAMFPL